MFKMTVTLDPSNHNNHQHPVTGADPPPPGYPPSWLLRAGVHKKAGSWPEPASSVPRLAPPAPIKEIKATFVLFFSTSALTEAILCPNVGRCERACGA